MTLTPTLRRAAVATGLSSLLLLSACTSNTVSTSSGTSSSASSSETSTATASATPTPVETTTTPAVVLPTYEAGQKLTTAQVNDLLNGIFANLTTVHMEMSTKSGGSSGTGDIAMSADADYSTNPISISGTMEMGSMGNTPMKVVLVDSNFYMNLGSLSQNLYIQISLAQLTSATGVNLADSFDPTKSVDQFSSAVTGGTYVGTETLNGVEVDHYTVAASTKKLVKLGGSALDSAPKSFIQRFTKKKTRTVESVWVDASGHVVKAVTQSFTGTTTVLFSKFGEPVTIEAPPSDQVTTAPGF